MTTPSPGSAPWFLRLPSTYLGVFLILLVAAAYVHAVLWAADLVIERTRPAPTAGVVAAADLPPGHFLRPSDVRLPGLNGYTKRRIDKDKPIVAADLTPTPNLSVPAGSMLAVLPINAGLLDVGRTGRIDVGSSVNICAKDGKTIQPAKVQAVICGGGGCSVVLPVPADKTAALAGASVQPVRQIKPCG